MKVRLPLFATSIAAALAVGAGAFALLAPAPAPARSRTTIVSGDGTVASESRLSLRRGDRKRARAEIRKRIAEGSEGTYITDILADHDSSLARWPERLARPISVWIQPYSSVRGWRPTYVGLAREAFDDWKATGIPLDFHFVADSAKAEVHLTWLDRFREPISGRTLWARDDDWWILDGSIAIAMHHRSGEALDAAAVKAITLHEVGHLIGLDHTRDPATIMTPRVRVRSLTIQDKATARLLYTLPAGAVR
jgi:Matrixin